VVTSAFTAPGSSLTRLECIFGHELTQCNSIRLPVRKLILTVGTSLPKGGA
jgi:hypothetical protein